MSAPLVELGNVVDVLSGFAFKSEYFNEENGVPVIRIRDVVRGYSDTYYSGPYTEPFVVQNGEIVVGMDGNFNAAKWNGGRALLNQRVCKVTPRDGLVDEGYLFHYLPLILKKIEDATPFVTVKHLSAVDLKKAVIPLPSLPEQRRIAVILDKADALRAKRREALSQLDRLAQSIFMEMFGDPVSNPKAWPENNCLGDVADIVSGVTKGRKLEGKATREIPYLAVANVQDMALNLSMVKTIEATEAEIQRYVLKEGDLLLTEGGDPDKLGRGTLWHGELDECIHQNHVFRVRLTSTALTPYFLNWIVGSARGKKYFLKSAKQTTGIASINMTQLRGFPLLMPPIELQKHFEDRIFKIKQQRLEQQASLQDLDSLFASLQHRAFQGAL